MHSSTVFEAFQEDMRHSLNSNMPNSADRISIKSRYEKISDLLISAPTCMYLWSE
jgi:hypothetical protein